MGIVTHKYADIDAVASALALAEALKVKSKGEVRVELVAPEGVSKPARLVVEKIGFSYEFRGEFTLKPKVVFIVDASTQSHLSNLYSYILESDSYKFLIDHHSLNTLVDVVNDYIIDSNASSTSEIIALSLPKELLTIKSALALMCGVISDTGRFSRASTYTFQSMAKLSLIAEYSRALSITSRVESGGDRAERIAVLKAMQRLILEFKDNLIIAGTHVSSFESEVASKLIRVGADIAVVASRKKSEVRVIIRARRGVEDKVFRVAGEIAKSKNASWGGHAGACVVIIPGRVEKSKLPVILKELLSEFLKAL